MSEISTVKSIADPKTKTFVLSSRHSLKFNNKHRLDNINEFVFEYQQVAEQLIKNIWREYGFDEGQFEIDIPKFIDNRLYQKYHIDTWLSSRVKQNIGKQVLAIIKGTIKKQKERVYRIQKLNEEGHFKQARKLKRIFDEQTISCPTCHNIVPQLSDQCFKNLKFSNNICWITLCCLKSNEAKKDGSFITKPAEIDVCFKLNKHSNSLQKEGKLKNSILISKNKLQFSFEFEKFQNNNEQVIGVDIGVNNVFTCSNKQTDIADKDGWTYSKILDKLSRQKKGSKNFIQTSKHRKQYLQWVVKQIGLENASILIRENIKDMYRGKNVSRKLKHFNYRLIFDVLDSYCQKLGVQVKKINQRYTSQRCSHCGYVHKRNRRGKQFKCRNCGAVLDADLNASLNISLPLKKLTKKQCKNGLNYSGFFWDTENIL